MQLVVYIRLLARHTWPCLSHICCCLFPKCHSLYAGSIHFSYYVVVFIAICRQGCSSPAMAYHFLVTNSHLPATDTIGTHESNKCTRSHTKSKHKNMAYICHCSEGLKAYMFIEFSSASSCYAVNATCMPEDIPAMPARAFQRQICDGMKRCRVYTNPSVKRRAVKEPAHHDVYAASVFCRIT